MKHCIPISTQLVSLVAWRMRPAWLASAFKRRMNVRPVQLDLDFGRMIVDPISNLGMRLIRDGYYEPELTNFLRATLKPGHVFADIGANEGYFSVLAGTLVGSTGRIITVEPQQRLHERIVSNFAANQIHRYMLKQVAISDNAGRALIHLTPDMNSGASGLSKITKYECETQEVEMITLSELLTRSQIDIVHTMKMDIEGYEYEAILGSREVFEQHRVLNLALELHESLLRKRGLDAARIHGFLIEYGYKHTRLGPVEIYQVADR